MPAAASAIALFGVIGHRLACVPYPGSSSPAAMGVGVLDGSIDYAAFANERSIRQKLWCHLHKTQLVE